MSPSYIKDRVYDRLSCFFFIASCFGVISEVEVIAISYHFNTGNILFSLVFVWKFYFVKQSHLDFMFWGSGMCWVESWSSERRLMKTKRRKHGQLTQELSHKFQLNAKPTKSQTMQYLLSGNLNSDPDSAIHYLFETEWVAALEVCFFFWKWWLYSVIVRLHVKDYRYKASGTQ